MSAVFSLVRGHHSYPRLQLAHQLPAHLPNADTTRTKSSGASMLNKLKCPVESGGFEKEVCFQNPSHWEVLVPWAASYNELMNARIQNEGVHHLDKRLLYFEKC